MRGDVEKTVENSGPRRKPAIPPFQSVFALFARIFPYFTESKKFIGYKLWEGAAFGAFLLRIATRPKKLFLHNFAAAIRAKTLILAPFGECSPSWLER